MISKSFSGRGVDRKFTIHPDDTELVADGGDSTRVVVRVTDEFGATRTYANDPIVFTLEGSRGDSWRQSVCAGRRDRRDLDPRERTSGSSNSGKASVAGAHKL